ncbi:NADH-cytochrome b5 reductase-like [Prorops nasuta]|uniref:NADH-cytochrome b5 reductase-like n=1 Tax=Prorops nasuta TaxID=863751 RepID=UPI0034CDFBA1
MDKNDSRPPTPLSEDCCGSGCNPCILDVHKKLLEEWEKKKRKNNSPRSENILNQIAYTKFIITKKSQNSADCILLLLQFNDKTENKQIFLNPGQHIMMQTNGVSRPFTPISWGNDYLLFLVKLYKNGKFSEILKLAMVGDIFNIRGPYGDFLYKLNSYRQIFIYCIGSGITAVYPIIKNIVESEVEETKIHLIAGFQTVSHIPLTKELRTLSDYWNFKCTLHISQKSRENASIHGIDIVENHIDKESVYNLLRYSNPEVTLVLICGTTEFNYFIKECVTEMNHTNIHIFE